ncbi:MAG: hypothetical protein JXA11_13495 [Phycisphaerae bacterium]|nr:hypothetical protein [Phycisphaerae bacterium]
MSALMEMAANAVLLPVERPRRSRGREDVKDRDASGLSEGVVVDAATVRSQKVTMAEENPTSARDSRAEDSQEHLDIFV